jgi:hypothetical protein
LPIVDYRIWIPWKKFAVLAQQSKIRNQKSQMILFMHRTNARRRSWNRFFQTTHPVLQTLPLFPHFALRLLSFLVLATGLNEALRCASLF